LAVLVNDLLDISRIEGGRIELDIEAIRLDGVVEQVVASLRGKVEEKGLSLAVNVPADLPPVQADRDRLIQILTNLVSNAHQYTHSGGSITVAARRWPRLVDRGG
jgi:signal transduction histidine kinase